MPMWHPSRECNPNCVNEHFSAKYQVIAPVLQTFVVLGGSPA